MELLNSFSLCIFVSCYLKLSNKTDLWEIFCNNIYSIFNKNKRKAVNPMLLRHSWKLFIKIFIKVIAVIHKWKVFHKRAFHLTSTIYLFLRWSKEKQTIHPISLTFFSNFLSCDFHVFIFFVFCISFSNSNKLNSISCGICLSLKSRHLEVFCKIIIQLFPTGIFVGLWWRGPPCNFTEELFFSRSCEWLLPII